MAARKGYTLLEVLLAVAIGLLLVAALYVALDVQLRYMQTGRDLVAEGQLARGLLNRLADDIRPSLAALPANQSGARAPGAGVGQDAAAADSGETATNQESAATAATIGKFNLGVMGDDAQIALFISVLPRFGQEEAQMQTGQSDLRRITYYLVPGQGLARQEVRNVMAVEPNPEDAQIDILANEVVELRFRYYDAQLGWVETWDGSTSGPPLAIEILMSIAPPESPRNRNRPPTQYRKVVAIPGAAVPQTQTSTATSTGGTP